MIFFLKKVQNGPDKQKRLSYVVFHRFRILCFKFHKGVLNTSINIGHMTFKLQSITSINIGHTTLSYNQSRVLIMVI